MKKKTTSGLLLIAFAIYGFYIGSANLIRAVHQSPVAESPTPAPKQHWRVELYSGGVRVGEWGADEFPHFHSAGYIEFRNDGASVYVHGTYTIKRDERTR